MQHILLECTVKQRKCTNTNMGKGQGAMATRVAKRRAEDSNPRGLTLFWPPRDAPLKEHDDYPLLGMCDALLGYRSHVLIGTSPMLFSGTV